MPTENKEPVKLYFKRKLKWYEKIWYLINGTLTIDDFEEFNEETIDDIADYIFEEE